MSMNDDNQPYETNTDITSELAKTQAKETKRDIALSICGIVLFSVLAIIFLAVEAKFIFGGEPQDINEYLMEHEELKKDDHVTINVDACLANYAETKHRINGIIPAGTDQHFIIWLDNNAVVSLKIKNKKVIKQFKALIDDTWEYLDGYAADFPTGIKIQGQVTTISPKIEDYYMTTLRNMGFTDSGLPIYYVEIDATATKLKSIMTVVGCLALDGLCVWLFIGNVKKRKSQKLLEKTL